MSSVSTMVAPPVASSELTPPAVRATIGATIGFIIGPTSIIAPPLGLFMVPVAAEFGLGRAGFPLLMMMTATLVGICSPIAGRLIDKHGVRKVVLPALFLSGLTQLALSRTTGSFPAFLAIMALVGILAGIQNPIAYTKVVAQWFAHKRGLMVAVAGAVGGGGGGVIVPLVVERCIHAGGWQFGYAGLGLFVLAGAPLVVWLLREPAAAGGAARAVSQEAVQPAAASLTGVSLGEALRTGRFWMILVALMGASGALVAMTVHVPAWISDAGGSGMVAAGYLSLFALGGVAGQLGCGVLLDRSRSARVCAVFFLLAALGVGVMQVTVPTASWLPAAGFISGMAMGAELGLACYLISRYFGLRFYGQIYGCIYGAMVVASGAGPVVMGIAFEASKNYMPAFAMAAGLLMLSCALIAALPRYTYAASMSARAV